MSGSASAATTPTTPKFFMIKKTPLGPIIFNDLFSETRELEKKLITKSGTTMSEKAIYRKLVRDDGLMGPKKDRYAVFLLFALKNGLSLLAETILKEPSTDLKREDLGCTALHYAVSSKKIPLSIIKILLERQPSIKNRRDSDGQTALFSAISDQYTKIAKLLLHFGANPNISNRNEVTPLFMAAFDGDLEMVKLLLKHKAVIVGTPSLSPLLCAIEGGHVSIVRELLDAGANPSIQMDTGETPMSIALKKRNKKMIKLLAKPCFPSLKEQEINELIIWSVKNNEPKILQALLPRDGNPNLKSEFEDGDSLLRIALDLSSAKILEVLIAAGANPSEINGMGLTVLHRCIEKSYSFGPPCLTYLNILLRKNPDLNVRDSNGDTPLILATKMISTEQKLIVKYLFEKNLPTLQERERDLMMFWAIENNDLEMLKILLARGGNPNFERMTPGNEATLLSLALCKKNASMVQALLEAGANPNFIIPRQGISALQLIGLSISHMDWRWTKSEALSLLTLLLNSHPDLNIPDQKGDTLLMANIKYKNTDAVRLLLAQVPPPKLDLRNKEGDTALTLAVKNKDIDLVTQLLAIRNLDGTHQNQAQNQALVLAAAQGDLEIFKLLLLNSAVLNPALRESIRSQQVRAPKVTQWFAVFEDQEALWSLNKSSSSILSLNLQALSEMTDKCVKNPDMFEPKNKYLKLKTAEFEEKLASLNLDLFPADLRLFLLGNAIERNCSEGLIRRLIISLKNVGTSGLTVTVDSTYEKYGCSPLVLALHSGSLSSARALLAAGADPMQICPYTHKALFDIKKINPETGDHLLLTAIKQMIKTKSSNFDLLALYLDLKIDVLHRNTAGLSALDLAIEAEDFDLVAFLIINSPELRANINKSPLLGKTALVRAADKNNPALCALLMSYGARSSTATTSEKFPSDFERACFSKIYTAVSVILGGMAPYRLPKTTKALVLQVALSQVRYANTLAQLEKIESTLMPFLLASRGPKSRAAALFGVSIGSVGIFEQALESQRQKLLTSQSVAILNHTPSAPPLDTATPELKVVRSSEVAVFRQAQSTGVFLGAGVGVEMSVIPTAPPLSVLG